ncbi:MAG: DUF6090 family protein [Flavobacteriales bacterium]|jgi:hypothetical protein|nr:DUF6090 family protein [Flavobacteriales bacterium]
MIKFFRKIRQRLLTENKFSKYLIYAIGEIILVVVGILIALQVNNWNEERKSSIETNKISEELNTEFYNNRIVLSDRIKDLNKANSYVRDILSLINNEKTKLRKVNIDSIISKSLKYGNYNPANSTINELISSGKLGLIKNNTLKENLFNWLQLIEDADEDFKNQDLQATTLLIPYLYKNVSMKNLNTYNNIGVDEKSELINDDYYKIFNDLEFENLYQGKLFWNSIMINHYRELDTLALDIIKQTGNIK